MEVKRRVQGVIAGHYFVYAVAGGGGGGDPLADASVLLRLTIEVR